MNRFRLITFLLLIIFASFVEGIDDSLTVKLSTENQLEPLYLLPIQTVEKSGYSEALETVLQFDLEHNGETFVVERSKENNLLGSSPSLEDFGSVEEWEKQGIRYVVKSKLENSSFTVSVLDVMQDELKKGTPVSLSGVIERDRREVHRIADLIFRTLFKKEGIASTKILYTVKTGDVSNVWECDYDGKNNRQITHEKTLTLSPMYLPPKPGNQSSAFLYVSYRSGQPKIMIANLKNGEGRPLIHLGGTQLMPAVPLTRDKIAFISDTATQNPDLFLQPFNFESGPVGKPQQIFSARQAAQASPTFSPDGKQIAFVSNKEGSPKVYVMDIPSPGTNFKEIKPRLISRQNRESSAPAWSPDGKKIAYTARSQGNRQLWVYDFSTNKEKQITKGQWNKENPSWAPDSFHLVYNTAENKGNNLFFIDINDSEPVQITSGGGEKRFPNWEPRR